MVGLDQFLAGRQWLANVGSLGGECRQFVDCSIDSRVPGRARRGLGQGGTAREKHRVRVSPHVRRTQPINTHTFFLHPKFGMEGIHTHLKS